MIFQLFLVSIISGILIVGLRKKSSREASPALRLFWILFWVGSAIIVLRPEITSRIAQLVGVGRGADLVIYSAILFLTAIVFTLLFWVDSIEESVTKIFRHMALKEYEQSEEAKKSSDTDPHI